MKGANANETRKRAKIWKAKTEMREAEGLRKATFRFKVSVWFPSDCGLAWYGSPKYIHSGNEPPSILYPWPLNASCAAAGRLSDLSILVLPPKTNTHMWKTCLYNYTYDDLHRLTSQPQPPPTTPDVWPRTIFQTPRSHYGALLPAWMWVGECAFIQSWHWLEKHTSHHIYMIVTLARW